MPIIPFYGVDQPELFAIERTAMDRPGHVVAALDRILPAGGIMLDVGAGNGFTAAKLVSTRRTIVALEPAARMIDPELALRWVCGDATQLPFRDASFDAAYATWAYFFSRNWDPTPGIREFHRVVCTGGPLIVVDNLGGDEFCALSERDITAEPSFWEHRGFAMHRIDTVFRFETMDDARRLLGFYFGEQAAATARLELSYRVGVFVGASRGV